MGSGNEQGCSVRALTLGLLAAVAAAGAAAAPPSDRPNMTGEQLVRDMLAMPDGGRNSIDRARAMGYIDGVMDATAGLHWCPAGQTVPHEMNYVVVEEMQTLSPTRLKGGAAALMLESLSRYYPCTPAGVKR